MNEGLNVNIFLSLADARSKLETWRLDYNEHRPHGSIGDLTPTEFASHWADKPAVEAPSS